MTKKKSQKKTAALTSVKSIFTTILAVAILIGILAAGFAFISQQKQGEELAETKTKLAVKLVSQNLSNIVSGYTELVKSLSLDADIPILLINEDQSSLEELARKMETDFISILKVRFLPKDTNEIIKDTGIPFSYAALDLIRRTESAKQILPAEMHLVNSPHQHIAFAVPVIKNDDLVGFIHVAVIPDSIFETIESVDANVVGLKLQQTVSGSTIDLIKSPAFNAQIKPNKNIAVNNSIWDLVYQPVSSSSLFLNMWTTLAILIGMVMMVLTIFIKKRSLLKALASDHEWILTVVDKRLSGSDKGKLGAFALAENKETMLKLSQMNAAVPSKAKTKANRKDDTPVPNFPSLATQSEAIATEVEMIDSYGDIEVEIFREYDIRGIIDETLRIEDAYVIGKAIGSLAIERGEFNMLVARDGRLSSNKLSSELIRGLIETGINTIDLGMVPTPVLYFGTHFLSANSGIVVTGSHNPANYNGFKIVISGKSLSGDEVRGLYDRIVKGQFSSGEGSSDQQDILSDYVHRITNDVKLINPKKIVLDCGHGVASVIAKTLFESFGCEVTALNCEVNGEFPNHHPDPGNPKNMLDLISIVKGEGADLGIAFDGDGDRIGVIDSSGKQIMPDRLLMLLADDVLARNPGADILYDIKSSKHLARHILSSGGSPMMWKSGHSLMKAKIEETGALLAGEFSGHIFFKERWYGFDDALYAGCRILEILSADERNSAEIFAELPDSLNTPEILLELEEGEQHKVMKLLMDASQEAFQNAKLIDIDGIRVEYPDAWGLVRASNTTPALVFRFEADDDEALATVEEVFRAVIRTVLPNVDIPF